MKGNYIICTDNMIFRQKLNDKIDGYRKETERFENELIMGLPFD